MQIQNVRWIVGLSVAAVALAGLSIGPARAEIESILSCSSTAPCLQWNNTGNGDAIKGISTNGVALEGQTKFQSAGRKAGKSAVLGTDESTSGTLNSGVSGSSANGTGVTGTSKTLNGVAGLTAGSGASGVYGQSSSGGGFGVVGSNTGTTYAKGAGVMANGGSANDGLQAFSTTHSGVYAFSQSGSALFANQGSSTTAPELYLQDTTGSNNFVIQAVGPSGDVFHVTNGGVMSVGPTNVNGSLYASGNIDTGGGLGVSGDTSLGGRLDVSSDSENIFQNTAAGAVLSLDAGTAGMGDGIFEIFDKNGAGLVYADDSGNMIITGTLTVYGGCTSGCVSGGKRLRAVGEYAPLESEPTIEDNGEGKLSGGFAYVALDPRFANVIDTTAGYIVTVTPEGDCRGLYVGQRSASGFAIRELQGGTSSVGFAYRVVAKRLGVHSPRLPMVDMKYTRVPIHRS